MRGHLGWQALGGEVMGKRSWMVLDMRWNGRVKPVSVDIDRELRKWG